VPERVPEGVRRLVHELTDQIVDLSIRLANVTKALARKDNELSQARRDVERLAGPSLPRR